jgi:hypothetical protein
MIQDENGVYHYHYEKAIKAIEFLVETKETEETYYAVLREMIRLDDLIESYDKAVKGYQDEVWELKEIIGRKNKVIREIKEA